MTDTSPHQTPEQRTTQQMVPNINPKPTHKEETKPFQQSELVDIKKDLTQTFQDISIKKVCIKPNCNCVQKRGKPPKKYTCSHCTHKYYCCDKTMHACYHFCPTVEKKVIPIPSAQFRKLQKI